MQGTKRVRELAQPSHAQCGRQQGDDGHKARQAQPQSKAKAPGVQQPAHEGNGGPQQDSALQALIHGGGLMGMFYARCFLIDERCILRERHT